MCIRDRLQPLGNASPQWDDALFFKVIDRPEVHLRGIDQILHAHAPSFPVILPGVSDEQVPHARTVRPMPQRASRVVALGHRHRHVHKYNNAYRSRLPRRRK